MAYKDPDYMKKYRKAQKEKIAKYQKDWNEKNTEHRKEYVRKKFNFKPRKTIFDLETHRQLAMNSGIETSREWQECYQLGLFPDGICCTPQEHFRKPEDKQ